MLYWLDGYGGSYVTAIQESLEMLYPLQAERAELFGLQDPSGISHNWRTGTLTLRQFFQFFFVHRTLALEILGSDPLEERSIVAGYREAISRIRQKELKDPTYRRALTEEEYECLCEVLCDEAWSSSVQRQDEAALKQAAEKILKRIHEEVEGPHELKTVRDIERLVEAWHDSFWLCVVTSMDHDLPEPKGQME